MSVVRKDILQIPDINSIFVACGPVYGERVSFSLQACQPVRCNPIPPMKYISPTIQVGHVFQQNLVLQCTNGNPDDGTEVCGTSLSASSSTIPSWTLKTCRRRHFFVILRRCCFNIFYAR